MPQDYDAAYKRFYERLFNRWNVPVETEAEVSRQALTIDVVIKCLLTHRQLLKDTCFWFFRSVNSFELKSPEDPLNVPGYMLIVSRTYALLSKQKDAKDRLPSNATITIVCSVRPDKILDELESEFHFSPTEEPGVYLSEQEIDRRIIVATELDVVEKNYPLLILAKGKKLLEFFEEIVNKDLIKYIEIMLQVGVSIDPKILEEGVKKMTERNPEFQAHLEQTMENLLTVFPESMRRIAQFREALEEEKRNAKRENLSLILETKFGPLSERLVSRLEAVRDVDELSRLCKTALQAQTLAEVDIPHI